MCRDERRGRWNETSYSSAANGRIPGTPGRWGMRCQAAIGESDFALRQLGREQSRRRIVRKAQGTSPRQDQRVDCEGGSREHVRIFPRPNPCSASSKIVALSYWKDTPIWKNQQNGKVLHRGSHLFELGCDGSNGLSACASTNPHRWAKTTNSGSSHRHCRNTPPCRWDERRRR